MSTTDPETGEGIGQITLTPTMRCRRIFHDLQEGFPMIDEKDFESVDLSFFEVGGFDKATLMQNLSFAPDWIPEDYIEFFQRFSGWTIIGTELATPGPAYGLLNHLQETVAVFRDEYPGYDHLFPIADIDDDCYLVFTNENGSVACGCFSMEDDEWFDGHPFASFTDWAYAQLAYSELDVD